VKIFISWAKEPSKTVAAALHSWLPDIIQSLRPFMSSADIDAGSRWGASIATALADCTLGIVCITPENQHDPWLTFESGALAKTLQNTYVCPYLIGMSPSQMDAGPLTQFQVTTADKDGTRDLLRTINKALDAGALDEPRLDRLFEMHWPTLDSRLTNLPSAQRKRPGRDSSDMLAELVETVRSISRRLPHERPLGFSTASKALFLVFETSISPRCNRSSRLSKRRSAHIPGRSSPTD
jgi:hypothetical protein